MEISIKQNDVRAVINDTLVQALMESVSDGVLIIDAQDRTVIAMNGRARELLDYTPSEVMGCRCQKLMNSPACSMACPLTAALEGRSDETRLKLFYRGREGNRLLHSDTRMLLVRGPTGTPLAGIELFSDLREVRNLKRSLRERTSLAGIIGRAPAMQALYDLVEQVAPYDLPVLITGESGVGKERFADAIQSHSSRAGKAYLKINCAALSPELVQSELFGHRRGAFTGANSDRRGFFEEATGGTLFLDEIGELPMQIQARLLRVLQEGELQRLGEDRVRHVNVRILAATNRDLAREVKEGRFRQDLYYRMLGAQLHIPPLRERREDIPLLVDHFLPKLVRTLNRNGDPQVPGLSSDALTHLVEQNWEGNVRELENTVRLGLIRSSGAELLKPEHLSPIAPGTPGEDTQASCDELPWRLADLEQFAIERAMHEASGNTATAAQLLGIDRSTLWRKIKKFT